MESIFQIKGWLNEQQGRESMMHVSSRDTPAARAGKRVCDEEDGTVISRSYMMYRALSQELDLIPRVLGSYGRI